MLENNEEYFDEFKSSLQNYVINHIPGKSSVLIARDSFRYMPMSLDKMAKTLNANVRKSDDDKHWLIGENSPTPYAEYSEYCRQDSIVLSKCVGILAKNADEIVRKILRPALVSSKVFDDFMATSDATPAEKLA